MNASLQKKHISTKDASKLSGYNPDYLSRLCRDGKIASQRIGRSWFVEQDSLEAFIVAQEERKREISETLSREREAEYRIASAALTATDTLSPVAQRETRKAVRSIMSAFSRSRLPERMPACVGFGPSAALTAVVLAFSVTLAGTGVVHSAGNAVFTGAFGARALAVESIEGARLYALEKRSALASAHAAIEQSRKAGAERVDPELAILPALIQERIAFAQASHSFEVPEFARADGGRGPEKTLSFAEASDAALTLAMHPGDALASLGSRTLTLYSDVGYLAVNDVETILATHARLIDRSGGATLSVANAMRGSSSRAPDALVTIYQAGLYAYVAHAEDVARAIVGTAFAIGDITARSLAFGIEEAPETYEQGMLAFSGRSVIAGSDIAKGSYVFGRGARERVAMMLAAEDRAIAQSVDAASSMLAGTTAKTQQITSHISTIVTNTGLGFAGNLALSIESAGTEVLPASPLAALDIDDLLPGSFQDLSQMVARVAQNAFRGILGPLASLFDASDAGLAVIPYVEMPLPGLSEPIGSVETIHKVEGDTIVYNGPVTIVQNEYPSVITTNGVSQSYVDTQIERLRYVLGRSIDNVRRGSSGSAGTGITSIDGLTGDSVTLNNPTINGGSINGSVLAVATTSIGGDLTVTGTIRGNVIEARDYIAGPYVLATSTTATSAFSGNIAVGRNTTLGATATDLLTVNSSIASNLIPSVNNTYDIGSASSTWRRIYADQVIIASLIDGCATVSGGQITSTGLPCGITNLNGQTGTTQTFAASASGGLTLSVSSSANTHTFSAAPAAGYAIPLTASTTEWATAFGWGNHATQGYLTAVSTSTVRSMFMANAPLSYSTSTGAFSLSTTGDWTGTFDGQEGSYYLARANHTGTQLANTISDFASAARGLFSSTATGLTYTSGTGVFSLSGGYTIPLAASTTQWDAFYSTPSTRITAGTGLLWTGNTLSVSTTSLALDTTYFKQNGNSFGATAVLGTNDANALQFKTNNATAMTILSGGNVGIGTAAPDSQLNTYTAAGGIRGAHFTFNNSNTGTPQVSIEQQGSGNAFMTFVQTGVQSYALGIDNMDGQKFKLNNSTASINLLTVTSAGNVGIGTSTPGTALSVAGTGTFGQIIDSGLTGNTLTYANASKQLSSVTLGSGLTFASGMLSVSTTSLALDTTYFKQNGNSFGGLAILGTNDSNALAFKTNNATRLTILTNGNIGIGTTTPASLLSLASTTPAITLRNTTGGGGLGQSWQMRVGATGTGSATAFDIYDVESNTSMLGILRNNTGDGQVLIGTTTNFTGNNSRLFVFGGNNGANIDTMGDKTINGGLGDVTNIEAEGSDWGVNGTKSIAMRYYGIAFPNIFSIGGAPSTDTALLDFGDATNSVIRTLSNTSLRFAIGNVERMRLTTTGLALGTTSATHALAVGGTGLFSGITTFLAGINVNNETFTDLTGSGLMNSSGVLTVDVTGDWTGTFDGQEGSYYLNRANHTGTQLASTISDFSTTARGLFSSTATGLTYTSGTGVFSLAAGYTIPLTASTSNWFTQGGNSFGASAILGTNDNNALAFETSGITRLTIDTSGSVGIGTTTPTAPLDVHQSGSASGIHLTRTGFTTAAFTLSAAAGGNGVLGIGSAANNFQTSFDLTNGNVGIGTSSPTRGLVLSSATTVNASIQLAYTASGGRTWDLNPFRSGVSNAGFEIYDVTAGASRIAIDASGNVGIGTTSPGTKLEVAGTVTSRVDGGQGVFQISDTGVLAAQIFDGATTGTVGILDLYGSGVLGARLRGDSLPSYVSGSFGIGTSTPVGKLDIYSTVGDHIRLTGATLDGALVTSGNNLVLGSWTNPANRLNLNMSTGNVGIGTTTPTSKLHVAGSSAELLQLERVGVRTWGQYVYGGGEFSIVDATAGAQRLTVSTSGNVGIGLTSPNTILTVAVSSGTTAGSRSPLLTGQLTSQATTLGGLYTTVEATGPYGAGLAFDVYKQNVGQVEAMRITNAGNVGIGTTTPSSSLTIATGRPAVIPNTSTASALIEFTNGGGSSFVGNDSSTGTGLVSNTPYAFSIYAASGLPIAMMTGASERMRITSAGNVGIGTTSPVSQLALENTSGSVLTLSRNDAIVTTGEVLGSLQFLSNDASTDSTGYAGVRARITAYDNGITNAYGGASTLGFFTANGDVTNLSEKMTILSNGNVGIGTTTPGSKLTVSDGDIAIGDTANTNRSLFIMRNNAIVGSLSAANNKMTLGSASGYDAILQNSSGAGVLVQNGTGNVGIGITPNSKLAVAGSIYSEIASSTVSVGVIAGNPGYNFVGYNGYWGMRTNSSNSAFSLDTYNGGAPMNAMTVLQNGNVGIGITNPSSKLEVNGSITTRNDVNIYGGNAFLSGLITANSSSGGLYLAAMGTNQSIRMVPSGTGNVEVMSGVYSNKAESNIPSPGSLNGSFMGPAGYWQLRSAGDHSLNFDVYNGGSQLAAMTILQNGNVGIGTVSPNTKLEVNGTILTTVGSGGTLHLFDNVVGRNNRFIAGADAGGAFIDSSYTASGTGDFQIKTLSSTKVTIKENGNVGIGSTNSGTKLTVSQNPGDGALSTTPGQTKYGVHLNMSGTNGYAAGITFGGNNGGVIDTAQAGIYVSASSLYGTIMYLGTTDNYAIGSKIRMSINETGGVRLFAYGAGTLTTDASGNITASSDERLKDVNGSFVRGLADIMALNPILYHWNQASGLDRTTQYAGFSAQNVQSVIPEAVTADPRGYLSLQDRPILAASVNAIKELAGRTDMLSTATSSLASRLSALEATPAVPADVTAAGIFSASLAVSGNADAKTVNTDALFAKRVVVPATTFGATLIELPSESLTTGGVDLYKLAVSTFAQTKELATRTDLILTRLDSIETRLAVLEAEEVSAEPGVFSFDTVKTAFASLGLIFEDGKVLADRLAANVLTIGTKEKPAGITFYDEETGEPYCLSVRNAQQHIEEGECIVKDLSQRSAAPTQPQTPAPAGNPPVFPGINIGSSTPQTGDTTAPTVTLNGVPAKEIEVNSVWSDPGAIATDDTDGDISGSIQVSGSVDTGTPGAYSVSYTATDSSGNQGSVSRMVIVQAPAAPVVVSQGAPSGG